ncbi:MAG: hypothetical protein IJ735_03150 [Clostridia bacterium]|nr:hypothetical protein [Clostridia bacterium]
MSFHLLTPAEIWAGFDAEKYGEVVTTETRAGYERLLFPALSSTDGDLVLDVEVFRPEYETKKAVLLIGPIERYNLLPYTDAFVKQGYAVFLPDYTAVKADTATVYPESLAYGAYRRTDVRLNRKISDATETDLFLYARALRRLVSFVTKDAEVAIAAVRSGGEVALQVAGTDDRVKGLALIDAAGYREYVKVPKYDTDKTLEIDDEMTAWLTGVSGTAYARRLSCPVIVAIGSNGKKSDLDRVSNFFGLVGSGNCRLTVSSGLRDSVDKEAFFTVLQWLEGVFVGSVPPEMPSIELKVNSSGELYAGVRADESLMINKVKVFFAFDDNDHSTRFWQDEDAEFAGEEYLARIPVRERNRTLYAYAEVDYVNGLIIDGVVTFLNLAGQKIKTARRVRSPIVFQHPDEHCFVEMDGAPILLKDGLAEGTIPVGLKGTYCTSGGMVTYSIGTRNNIEDGKLLQIDSYSDKKQYELTVRLLRSENGVSVGYTAKRWIEVGDTFNSLRLRAGDFKQDRTLSPMPDWRGIKALIIVEKNVVIGKIMFI